jgi:hypothetical protein
MVDFEEIITVDSMNLGDFAENLSKNGRKQIVTCINPSLNYEKYPKLAVKLSEFSKNVIPFLTNAVYVVDIPYCLFPKKYHTQIIPKKYNSISKTREISLFTKLFFLDQKIKSDVCSNCIENLRCHGLYKKYVMQFGFGELKAITLK